MSMGLTTSASTGHLLQRHSRAIVFAVAGAAYLGNQAFEKRPDGGKRRRDDPHAALGKGPIQLRYYQPGNVDESVRSWMQQRNEIHSSPDRGNTHTANCQLETGGW